MGPRVIIVDDMLDTGSTLVSACEKLTQAGVREIYILVTHDLFTGSLWKRLWSLGVKHIFCTDTIPACCGSRNGANHRLIDCTVASDSGSSAKTHTSVMKITADYSGRNIS